MSLLMSLSISGLCNCIRNAKKCTFVKLTLRSMRFRYVNALPLIPLAGIVSFCRILSRPFLWEARCVCLYSFLRVAYSKYLLILWAGTYVFLHRNLLSAILSHKNQPRVFRQAVVTLWCVLLCSFFPCALSLLFTLWYLSRNCVGMSVLCSTVLWFQALQAAKEGQTDQVTVCALKTAFKFVVAMTKRAKYSTTRLPERGLFLNQSIEPEDLMTA